MRWRSVVKRFFPYVALLILISMVPRVAQTQTNSAAKQHASNGQQVFIQKCMACHSVNKDQVMTGPSLWSETSKSPHKKSPAQIRTIIQDGKGKMPPWKTILTPDQVDDVIAYLRTL
jgi:mono/diheme cytochrome c family protein